MSIFADFLKENNLSVTQVAQRSQALESFNDATRAQKSKRVMARENKKPYAEVGADKPGALGRGVSERAVNAAVAGEKLPRVNRKKITRAVSSLMVSQKKEAVDWRKLFSDVGAKKGKSAKA